MIRTATAVSKTWLNRTVLCKLPLHTGRKLRNFWSLLVGGVHCSGPQAYNNKTFKIIVTLPPAKGKFVPVLFSNWAPLREGLLWEWRYSSTYSLTAVLDGGEWLASRPSRFALTERAPGTNWIGGWVGPRTILGAMVKRELPSPRRESNHGTPIV
jgi:hypothetical protein